MQQVMLWLNRGFAELPYEIQQVITNGDTVVIHCTATGRHCVPSPDGRSCRNSRNSVLRRSGSNFSGSKSPPAHSSCCLCGQDALG
jgi:hypothetical protein